MYEESLFLSEDPLLRIDVATKSPKDMEALEEASGIVIKLEN